MDELIRLIHMVWWPNATMVSRTTVNRLMVGSIPIGHPTTIMYKASIAQLVEHLTCNEAVRGSIPRAGSNHISL